MSSEMARRLHEPALLLDQPRGWRRRRRGYARMNGTGEEVERPVGVQLPELLPPNPLQLLAGDPPGVDPFPAGGDLLRRPAVEGRASVGHRSILITLECSGTAGSRGRETPSAGGIGGGERERKRLNSQQRPP